MVLNDGEIMELAREFDLEDCDDPKDRVVCGFQLAAFARKVMEKAGVPASLTDDDLMAIAAEFDSAPEQDIAMLCGDQLLAFARAVLDRAGRRPPA